MKEGRYRRPEREVLIGSAVYLDSLAQPIQEDTPNRESVTLVEGIIKQLNPVLQEIYYLRYAERLSLRQIARRFGRSKGWAQWNVRKLHEEVRKQYELLRQEATENPA